jgi:hypothetical protein
MFNVSTRARRGPAFWIGVIVAVVLGVPTLIVVSIFTSGLPILLLPIIPMILLIRSQSKMSDAIDLVVTHGMTDLGAVSRETGVKYDALVKDLTKKIKYANNMSVRDFRKNGDAEDKALRGARIDRYSGVITLANLQEIDGPPLAPAVFSAIGGAIRGTVDAFRGVPQPEVKVAAEPTPSAVRPVTTPPPPVPGTITVRCIGCGVSLTGMHGSTGSCGYCHTRQMLTVAPNPPVDTYQQWLFEKHEELEAQRVTRASEYARFDEALGRIESESRVRA